MGIDALDIIFRLENAFHITIPKWRIYWSDEQRRLKRYDYTPVTVGDIHQRRCDLLREMNLPVPEDSWERVTKCVGDALVVPPASIRPEDRLVEDLGAT